MKQILRMTGLIRPLLLMLALLLFGNARGWAEVSTLTFTKACGGAGTADDGVAWTVTSDGSESNFDSAKGIHYGTGSASVQYIKLTTEGISGTITKVVVNASTASGVSATADVTVDGQAFGGNAQSLTSSATNYTFTGSASGKIVVTVTKPSSATKAIYVKSVAVTYSTVADNRTAVNMTGFTATSTALVKGNTTTTTVTNDQPGWTAAYTYASSNENVATVANDGVITAVGKGTAVITASLNVNPEDASYKAGNVTQKTVEITVSLPTHTATFSVNGQTTTQDFEEGAAITFPADPADVEGKTFVGWVASLIEGTTNTVPSFVTSETMGTADITYYACFAEADDTSAPSLTKMTSNDSFAEGDKIVIVAEDNVLGLTAMYQETVNKSYVNKYSFNNNVATVAADDKNWLTLTPGSNNTWKLGDSANGYVYTGSSNDLEISANSSTNFTIAWNSTESKFTIIGSNRWLSYRSDLSNRYFRMGGATTSDPAGVAYFDIYKYEAGSLTYSNYCTTVAADTREEAGIAFTGTTNEYTANLYGEFEKPALENSHKLAITYSSSNTDVATVDASTGAVTLVGVGVTTISAAFEGNDDYKPATVSYTLTVADNRQVADLAFTGTTSEYTANLGEAFSNPELSAPQGVTITYSSSNTAVATVDASTGAVTLVAAGETTITATSEANNNYKAGTASYTLTVVDPNAPGTQNNPYTVAQARAAIDAGTGLTDVYATGIVSKIVTAYNSQYGNITYNISTDGSTTADQLQAYHGKAQNGENFTSEDDIQVGDEVVIYGTLKKYNTTYEFDANNQLVSLKRKAEAGLSFDEETATAVLGEAFTAPTLSNEHQLSVTWSSSNTAVATIDASTGAVTLVAAGETTITASFAGNNNYKAGSASYTLTVESNEPSIVFDGIQNPALERCTAGNTNIHYVTNNLTEQVSIVLCDAEGIAATYDWFSAELYGESYVAVSWQANEDAENDRTAYFYLQSGNTRSEIFALTQEKFVADYAALPFAFDGGKADIEKANGLSQTGLGSDYGSSPYLKFDTTGDNLILKLNEAPGTLTFDIKGNSFSGGTFKVQTSADGVTYTDLESYTTFANNTQSEEFDNLSDNVRYIKWIYTEKNEGNVALGNIKVDKYVAPSTEPTITLSATSIEATFAEADGTITVTCENMGDAPALDIIFCDAQGTEATYNWIDADINDENNVYYTISANEGEARTAYMKVYGLDTETNDVYSELITITQEAYVEATSYALATDINAIGSGKHYIIVSNDNNGYFAMGAQNQNNRAAVSVTANNGTISVSSQDVKEVVIVGPDKDSHYAIYDGTGYLYAVSSSDNYLKTKEELDANGLWSISFDDGTHAATITASGDKARNNLRFNTQSTLFSCYRSGQADVYLYEKVNDTPEATDVVNITSAGYATYCSEHALDFSNATGIKAYVGTLNGTELTFTPITKVPARTGVLLQSTGGTEVGATIIPITTTPSEVTNNCLTGVTAETNLSSEDYILNVKEAGAGFYKAGNYTTLGANRAYIAAQQGGQVKGFVINLNGDLPTGVAQMDGEKLNADDAAIFNLNGQRMSKLQKGVNIVNGKKVLVK